MPDLKYAGAPRRHSTSHSLRGVEGRQPRWHQWLLSSGLQVQSCWHQSHDVYIVQGILLPSPPVVSVTRTEGTVWLALKAMMQADTVDCTLLPYLQGRCHKNSRYSTARRHAMPAVVRKVSYRHISVLTRSLTLADRHGSAGAPAPVPRGVRCSLRHTPSQWPWRPPRGRLMSPHPRHAASEDQRQGLVGRLRHLYRTRLGGGMRGGRAGLSIR